MGLGTIELLMQIEDEFDFRIPDADAEAMQTCGQLCAYVLGRIAPRPAGRTVCPRARAFFALRRALMRQVPSDKSTMRPGTRLADVLTEPYRRRWPAVAREIGLEEFYTFGGRCETFFPAPFTRLGDLARRIALPKPFEWLGCAGPFEERVWQRVRQIVARQTGVRVAEIHPHTHLIRDLCMD